MKFLNLFLIFSFLSVGNLYAYVDYSDKRPFFESYPMNVTELVRNTEFTAEELASIKSFLQKATVGNSDNLLNLGEGHAKETALHFLLALGDFENAKLYVDKYGSGVLKTQNSEGVLAFIRMLPSTRQHLEARQAPAKNILAINDWFLFVSQRTNIKALLKHKDRYKQSMFNYIKQHREVYESKTLPHNQGIFKSFEPLRRLKGLFRK